MSDSTEMQQVLTEAMNPELIPYVERVGVSKYGHPFVIYNFADDAGALQKFKQKRGIEDCTLDVEGKEEYHSGLSTEAVLWLKGQQTQKRFRGRVLDIDPVEQEDDEEDPNSGFQLSTEKLHEHVAPDGTVYVEDLQDYRITLGNAYLVFLAIRREGEPGFILESCHSPETIESRVAGVRKTERTNELW